MISYRFRKDMIAENFEAVTQRIAACCGRSGRPPGDVRLVCVTKEAPVDRMKEALGAGARTFGENRVQEAAAKHPSFGPEVEWHLVGHLQTNKARDAVRIFNLIHSVDSLRLASEIDKEARKAGKVQDILIQVNTSGEASKFGIKPEEAGGLLKEISALANVRALGLMTIAPEADDPEAVRPYFRKLRELRDNINAVCRMPYAVRHLSMGMTNDFEVAIEEGATLVRVGRGIFGERY
jgi:pyridoxal phosphate enzyme (YggS family)